MARGIVLGLILGVAVGWMVFARDPEIVTETVPEDRHAELDARPELDAAPMAVGSPDAEPVEITEADVLDAIRNEDWLDMKGRVDPADIYTDAVVAALIERAKAAFDAGNRAEFLTCVELLQQADHPHARDYFVTLLSLGEREWPGGFHNQGMVLMRGLSGQPVPGVAAAARERIEAHVSRGPGFHASDGWRRLVLQHGTEADIAWLIDLDGSPAPMCHVAMSEDLETAERHLDLAVAEAVDGRRLEVAHLVSIVRVFAGAHPDAGFPVLADALRSGALLGVPYQADQARVLGDALREISGFVSMDRVESAVLATPDATRRFRATEALAQHLPSDSALLAQPVETIRAAARAGPVDLEVQRDVSAACSLLRVHRFPLTDGSVSAMEELASVAVGPSAALVRGWARDMRASLGARWR